MEKLLEQSQKAIAGIERLAQGCRETLSEKITRDNAIDMPSLERYQFIAHGYAWIATYLEAIKQLAAWAGQLQAQDTVTELEQVIYKVGIGGYLQQLLHGIPMSQDEVIRPDDFASSAILAEIMAEGAIVSLIKDGDTNENRLRIVELIIDADQSGEFGELALGETLNMVRDQFRRFADEEISNRADEWHRQDRLIPIELIRKLAELGVFAVCIPEEYAGHAMGKLTMCVITEELARGYIGVGSIATRSEIAAELILNAGTAGQKKHYLPKIASGEMIPAAVFTEPDRGSDLAGLTTRAVKNVHGYEITGNKTWSTHAARANLMTLLARTNPTDKGYKGLSMFLIEKPSGADNDPFPSEGMSGSEIPVIGYRGMKEYELSFDRFKTGADALLGGVEGQGFKQLMSSFETARIQTAARGIGVARNALELALRYARQRMQFGKPILAYPRVAGKIGWMVAEIMLLRQLVYYAARRMNSGKRCDIEAGMAKLLSAKVAWSCADNALQIHGGNGYAVEYSISRVLCDARVLNIFEGSAEIQANVIARGLLHRHLQQAGSR